MVAGPEPFWPTDRTAEFIGVDDMTLRRWAQQGVIPAYKCGPRQWRFRPSEVEAWILSSRSSAEKVSR
jgi:excisionase family DNA binding protein